MLSFYYTYAIAGTIAGIIGVGLLRFSWLNKKKSLPKVVAGWLAILLSSVLWGYAGGPDRGTAMGIMTIGVVALGFCFIPSLRQEKASKAKINRTQRNVEDGSSPTIFKNIGLFILLFLGCGIASFVAALGSYELMLLSGISLANGLVWALFLFPCIWAGTAIHMLMSDNIKNRIIVLVSCVSFGSILMLVGN